MTKEKKAPEIVDLRDRVKVYPTASAPYHQAEYANGEAIEVAPKVAEKMLENGWATKNPGESTNKSGKSAKNDEK